MDKLIRQISFVVIILLSTSLAHAEEQPDQSKVDNPTDVSVEENKVDPLDIGYELDLFKYESIQGAVDFSNEMGKDSLETPESTSPVDIQLEVNETIVD